MSNSYIWATDAFAALLDRRVRLADIRWVARLYITPLQEKRIKQADPALQAEMFGSMGTIWTKDSPTGVAIELFESSRDVASCTADNLFDRLAAAFGRRGAGTGYDEDLIIAQIGIRNDLCVVTADCTVFDGVRDLGGHAMLLSEFLHDARRPPDHRAGEAA